MTLSEAAKLRQGTNKKLARERHKGLYFIPNSETTYIGFDDGNRKKDPAFGWQPNEQDLIADDWILID